MPGISSHERELEENRNLMQRVTSEDGTHLGSARYTMPGIVAHESVIKGGVLMEIPDLGLPPEKAYRL